MAHKEETFDIEYCNVVLFVTGYYSPEEKRVMYNSDLSGYPGAPAEFDIDKIQCGRQDIMDLLSGSQLDEIEQLILNTYYDHEY